MARHCFVIQGFGKKQDYQQGKLFNLDASYAVIREAVENAGFECHRADELRTTGMIDQVMYDQLLDADLVVADITTLNFNAAYELGVRHALRPRWTLVIGEQGINFPFDINHVYVHTYKHLGEDIGYQEVKRFQQHVKEQLEKAFDTEDNDSPVYTFLKRLPAEGQLQYAKPAQTLGGAAHRGSSLRELVDQAEAAMREERFTDAIPLWDQARHVGGKNDYVVQQLALATYKSKAPDPEIALRKAEKVLEYLKPRESFDPETLGLWAAVHKRLFESGNAPASLEEALFALERGFFLREDYYNGINLAFVLDTKANASEPSLRDELRAVARYVRRKVKAACVKRLADPNLPEDERYWVLATLYEACVGLGEEEKAGRWKTESEKAAKARWMAESTQEQIAKLRALLA